MKDSLELIEPSRLNAHQPATYFNGPQFDKTESSWRASQLVFDESHIEDWYWCKRSQRLADLKWKYKTSEKEFESIKPRFEILNADLS